MRAIVLSIGTELTTGQQVDTNAVWLAGELTSLGATVIRKVAVADDREAIRDAVADALRAAEVTVATGGLGPTPDDLTRDAIADAIGAPLEEDPGALAEIQSVFDRMGRPFHRANRGQACLPRGCRFLSNAHGTAPGIHVRGERELFALPGVPAEMKAMFERFVIPAIRSRAGHRRTVIARLQSFGISEARVGELLGEMMRPRRNPQVGTSAAHGVIGVRIVATGEDEEGARAAVQADVAEICGRLGAAVFGQGDAKLESVVGDLLRAGHKTIATAESCTGGLLSKRLTDVPGSSAYFLRGFVTYTNEAKTELLGVPADLIREHGAVSAEVAGEMAAGCKRTSGADYAVGITGIAGPSGGTADKPMGLVYVGLADAEGLQVETLRLGSHPGRQEIRDRSCSAALNLLRLRLVGLRPATG